MVVCALRRPRHKNKLVCRRRSLLGAGSRPDMVPRSWSFGWSGTPASEIAMHALSLCMHATCAPFLASLGGLRISHLLARVTPRWILGLCIVHSCKHHHTCNACMCAELVVTWYVSFALAEPCHGVARSSVVLVSTFCVERVLVSTFCVPTLPARESPACFVFGFQSLLDKYLHSFLKNTLALNRSGLYLPYTSHRGATVSPTPG